MPGREIEVAAG